MLVLKYFPYVLISKFGNILPDGWVRLKSSVHQLLPTVTVRVVPFPTETFIVAVFYHPDYPVLLCCIEDLIVPLGNSTKTSNSHALEQRLILKYCNLSSVCLTPWRVRRNLHCHLGFNKDWFMQTSHDLDFSQHRIVLALLDRSPVLPKQPLQSFRRIAC